MTRVLTLLAFVVVSACECRLMSGDAAAQHDAERTQRRIITCKYLCQDNNAALPYRCIEFEFSPDRCHCQCPNGEQPQVQGVTARD